jgi:hypothetical protein
VAQPNKQLCSVGSDVIAWTMARPKRQTLKQVDSIAVSR